MVGSARRCTLRVHGVGKFVLCGSRIQGVRQVSMLCRVAVVLAAKLKYKMVQALGCCSKSIVPEDLR